MSAETEGAVPTESELRERFPEVIQGRAEKAKVLHLPDPDTDQPEPMCDRHTSNGWRSVSIGAFPPGHRDFCTYCKRRLCEQDRCEPPRGPTTPSWTVKQWEKKHCDAMQSDW